MGVERVNGVQATMRGLAYPSTRLLHVVIHTRLWKTLGLLGRTSCPRWGLACPQNPSPGPAIVNKFRCNDGTKSILLCIY